MADLKDAIGAVIDRWYHLGLIRFSSRDDGGDDLILRDEIARAVEAAAPSSSAGLDAADAAPLVLDLPFVATEAETALSRALEGLVAPWDIRVALRNTGLRLAREGGTR